MNKINEIAPSGDALAEARERTEAMMIRSMDREEFDFESRMQEAIAEVWQKNKESRENTKAKVKEAEDYFDSMRNNIYFNCGDIGVNRVPQS